MSKLTNLGAIAGDDVDHAEEKRHGENDDEETQRETLEPITCHSSFTSGPLEVPEQRNAVGSERGNDRHDGAPAARRSRLERN